MFEKKIFLRKEKNAGVAAGAAAQPTWSTISWYQNLVENRRAPLNCSRTHALHDTLIANEEEDRHCERYR